MYFLKKAFPDIAFPGDDARTEEEIAAAVKEIYDKNGVYEEFDYGGRILAPYYALWLTYKAATDAHRDGRDWCAYNVFLKIEDVARVICTYPEIKKAFLMEEAFYKTKF